MADVRAQHESEEWINLGTLSAGNTIGFPTYVSATSFTIAGNVASIYHVNRRIKATGTTPFTIYGTITASSYTSPNTTITVAWDSGSLDATLNTVWYGVVSAQNSSLTAKAFGAATLNGFGAQVSVASAATTDLGTTGTNNAIITGTTAITSFGSSASTSSPIYQVYFSGVLTLTQNATSLILPGGANITTAAGDSLTALYLGSGNWRVLEYHLGNGKPLLPNISPTGYAFSGLVVKNNATSPSIQIDVQASSVLMQNTSAGSSLFAQSIALTVNSTTVGANGLDAGSMASSNWYYLYLISNGTTVASLISLSPSTPTLPSGYTFSILVSAIYYTGPTNGFMRFIQRGRQASFVPTPSSATASFPTVASGSATNLAVSLSSVVPTQISGRVFGGLYNNGGSGTATVSGNNNNTGGNPGTPPNQEAALNVSTSSIGYLSTHFEIVLQSSSIYFTGTTAGMACVIMGWELNI